VDVLLEGARAGRPEDEIRELLVRLVPEFKVPANTADAALGALPN
jgi:hypothetical protein